MLPMHYKSKKTCRMTGLFLLFFIFIHWIGQQLDATDEEKVFKIGPDCWELFDGKTDYTVKKSISQESFDEAISLAADELNISIL